MKFLLSWLKEYIEINLSDAQLAKVLNSVGIEVDAVDTVTPLFEGVVIAHVLEVKSHPNADKLAIATVSDGSDVFQVVCGAPNCRVGIKTAFAPVGAKVHDKFGKLFTIQESSLRGIASQGMLCSEHELLQNENHEGIIEFAPQLQVGADLAAIYHDTLVEVSITPNLAHCSCMIGLARELSAATKSPVQLPPLSFEENQELISSFFGVTVVDAARCERYACRIATGVTVAPSPEWMQKRLQACGVRPVNNIVDIGNYVMLETGQPLHIFDLDTLEGGGVTIRSAEAGEKIVTLDGVERTLTSEELLICDKGSQVGRPLAIAGIMGGRDSEVSDSTTRLLIEAAIFLPSSIRRSSKRLGLQSEASRRFERGIDPNGVQFALDRAAMLIDEIAGGRVSQGSLDSAASPFPQKIVCCRLSRINSLLGTHLSLSEVEGIFQRLDFEYSWDSKDLFTLTIPTWRGDISLEVDLIEEVARIYGYDNIPKGSAQYRSSEMPHSPIFLFEGEVRQRLIAEGAQELLTCDLIGPSILSTLHERTDAPHAQVEIMNPTSVEQSILRTSMLPGLLQVVKHNFDHQNGDICGFEIGRIHFREKEQYIEQSMAALIMSGSSAPHNWDRKGSEVDFFDLKGIIENSLSSLRAPAVRFKPSSLKTLHPHRQAAICIDALEIGAFGEVHPAIVRRLNLPQRIFFGEINLHDLFKVRLPANKAEELPIFPSSSRDWTVTLEKGVSVQSVFDAVAEQRSPLLEDIFLLDLYSDSKLADRSQNATFRFIYRDKGKTTSQANVDAEHARIMNKTMKIITH